MGGILGKEQEDSIGYQPSSGHMWGFRSFVHGYGISLLLPALADAGVRTQYAIATSGGNVSKRDGRLLLLSDPIRHSLLVVQISTRCRALPNQLAGPCCVRVQVLRACHWVGCHGVCGGVYRDGDQVWLLKPSTYGHAFRSYL